MEEYIAYKRKGDALRPVGWPIRKPEQSDVELFMNVLGRSLTVENEKILFTLFEPEGIIDKRREQWLVTTDKALWLSHDQKTVEEILFSDIRYFVSTDSFINMQWKVAGGFGSPSLRILMSLYGPVEGSKRHGSVPAGCSGLL